VRLIEPDLLLLIKGIITGLLVSIPLGPIGILVIQRTLNKGRLSGFVSGLGATVADIIFALIAGLGLSIIINFIRDKQTFFQIAGGLFVLFIGFRIFYTNPVKALRLQRMSKTMLSQDFVSAFLLTLSNPLAIFIFIAIMAAINIAGDKLNFFQLFIMLAGVFTGAAFWWSTLSSIANRFRKKIRLRSIWWMNKVTGTVVFIFGIAVVVSVWLV
jgi:threonine/homoserine/homoserine lactone efflux protein